MLTETEMAELIVAFYSCFAMAADMFMLTVTTDENFGIMS